MGRQVEEQYIQTGKVRFGYLHFTILGFASVFAAEASECAADQGQFWAYHDLLFQNQTNKNKGSFNENNLKLYADKLGLNSSVYEECMESNTHIPIIQDQTSLAKSLGIQGTPAFMINGKTVVGAQTFEGIQIYIEEALQAVSP